MIITEYNEDYGEYEFANESESQYSKIASLQSLVLGNEIATQDLPFLKEYECIKRFFDAPFNSPEETSLKKVFATGIVAAIGKGILPFTIDKSPEVIASTIDSGLSSAKIAYKVAIGDIDAIEAADKLIDHCAAKMITVADKALDYGIPIVAKVIPQMIARVFPPAAKVAPQIESLINRSTPLIKQIVHKGINHIASYAKSIVQSVAKSAKSMVKASCKVFKSLSR